MSTRRAFVDLRKAFGMLRYQRKQSNGSENTSGKRIQYISYGEDKNLKKIMKM